MAHRVGGAIGFEIIFLFHKSVCKPDNNVSYYSEYKILGFPHPPFGFGFQIVKFNFDAYYFFNKKNQSIDYDHHQCFRKY